MMNFDSCKSIISFLIEEFMCSYVHVSITSDFSAEAVVLWRRLNLSPPPPQMQSVMYELMSELNDRSEDLERQMLSLEQRVEQLTAGFTTLPAHLSATLSAQHAALVHLLRERDGRDGGGGGGAIVPASPAATVGSTPSSPVPLASPAASAGTPTQVPSLALDSPLPVPTLTHQGSLEVAGSNLNTSISNC